MKFTAVGDILPQKRMPNTYEGFDDVKYFISRGDARFFNLETTLNYEGECYASQFSGGTYVRCEPEVLSDMLRFGFNMTTFNNNHAMDFSHDGLVKTLKYVNDTKIVHSGVGMNLAQASAPSYLETEHGRVAIIAVNTSFNPAMMAGEQSRRIVGRPGINGITVAKKLMVTPENFESVSNIAALTGVNKGTDVIRKEGYIPMLPEGVCELGDMIFIEGNENKVVYEPSKSDIERVKHSIKEASMCSDYVILSIHSHQLFEDDKTAVPEFLQALSHLFIDFGADAIIGHGPHLLRPIEVYKDKPIFYSLGDFVIQLYDVPIAPEEFYKKYGLTSDSSVIELLEKRSAGFTRGLMEDVRMLESVIPYWETDADKKLTKLVLKPIKASKGDKKSIEGLPQPAKDLSFIDHFAKMCEPYGVKITMKDGLCVCEW